MFINEGVGGTLWQIFRGVVIAVLITLISVLIFAFILSASNLSDKVIKPTNQCIKTLSVVVAVFLVVREGKFLLKGGLIGLLSALFSILLFALIAGTNITVLASFVDVAFGFLIGLISGGIVGKILKW